MSEQFSSERERLKIDKIDLDIPTDYEKRSSIAVHHKSSQEVLSVELKRLIKKIKTERIQRHL